MPLYEYQCERCGRFEVIRKFADEPLAACPTCGQPVQRLPSAPAIQFKGTGWYVTDYARKSSPADGAQGSAPKESSAKDSSAPAAGDSKAAPAKDGAASGGSTK